MSRSFDYKLIADMSASNATIGTATISSGTVTNLVGTNISAGSMSLSSAIASSSLTTSNLVATTSSAGTAVASAFTGGSVSVSGAVAAASVAATTVAATSGTIGAFAATTSSAGTAVATAFTGGSVSVSGAVAASSVAAASGTIGAFVATTSSAGTAVATVFTGGSLSLSGNINIAGTLTTVNITTTNLSQTNVSAGSITATTVSAGTAVATAFTGGAISVSGAATANSIVATSGTVGTFVATTSSAGTAVATVFTGGSIGVSGAVRGTYLQIDTTAAANQAFYITNPSSTSGSYIDFFKASGAQRFIIGIDGHNFANIESGASMINAWTATSPIIFAHANTERMRIATNGTLRITGDTFIYGSADPGFGNVSLCGTSGSYIDFGPDTIDYRSRIIHSESDRSLQISFNQGLNSGFMTFASTGNVGIGVNPNANHKLSVNGSISVNEWNQHIGFVVNDAFTFQNATVPNYGLSWSMTNGAAGAVAQISGWGGINFFTQTTPRVTIDGSGNVGIGTTSPSKKLHVSGLIRADGGIDVPYGSITGVDVSMVMSADTEYNLIQTSHGGGMWVYRPSFNNGDLRFKTNTNITQSNTVMTLTAGQNVGIGTTIPATKLTVMGTGNFSGVASTAKSDGMLHIRRLYGYENSSTTWDPILQMGSWEGDKNLGRTTSYAFQYNHANLSHNGGFQLAYFQASDYVHNGAGTVGSYIPSMTWQSNYVGIGTTSPEALLHVDAGSLGSTAGDSTILQRWRQLTANGNSIDLAWVRTANGSNWDTAGQRFQALTDTTYQGWMQFNNGGDGGIAFGSGGAYTRTDVPERMRITSSGLVGIGTTSPSDILHLRNSTANSNMGLVFQNGSRQYRIGIRGDTSNILAFTDDTAAAFRMVITSSGNIGINTDTPQARLDVRGNMHLQEDAVIWARSQDFSHSGSLTLQAGYPAPNLVDSDAGLSSIVINGYRIAGESSSILFNTQKTRRMTIQGDTGNLGIGVSSPSYQLHLSSDSAAKPSTNTWTVSSDERAKTNITMANLDTCYNNVKNLPLKRYTWRDDIYTAEEVPDRSKLGWIAQDVETVIPKAVTQTEQHGYSDFRSLNSDQIIASLYGCVQKLIEKVESLESEIAQLKQ